MGFLTDAVERIRREIERNPPAEGSLLLRANARPPALDFAGALRSPGISIVAEVKRASPSSGTIADADAGEQAARYERAGAAAVSVLTEARHFHGSLLDVRAARRRTRLPIVRKDFLVHPAQVLEARAEGADAVLLIAVVLSRSELEAMLTVTAELGMGALVEVHAQGELERALAAGAEIVGVNARDLETLEVDAEAALELARSVPPDRILVLESGISTRRQVVEAEEAGADAVLVGEALMRSDNPERTIRRLLGSLALAEEDG